MLLEIGAVAGERRARIQRLHYITLRAVLACLTASRFR